MFITAIDNNVSMDEELRSGAVITPEMPKEADAYTESTSDPMPAEPAPQPILAEDPFKPDSPAPPHQKPPKVKRSSGGMPKAGLALIIILLMVAAAAGVYFWQHGQVTKAQNQTDTLNKQVASLQKQVDELTKANKEAAKKAATTSQTIIRVKELGVQFTVPDSLKDLTYTIKTNTFGNNQTELTAYFSTASLLAKDKQCTSDRGSIGAISKVDGTYPANPTPENSGGVLAKQFTNFYIGYSRGQSACSMEKTAQDLQGTQIQSLHEAVKTVELLS